jgi:hypothetical protein
MTDLCFIPSPAFPDGLKAVSLTAPVNYLPRCPTRKTPAAGISWQLFFAYNDARRSPSLTVFNVRAVPAVHFYRRPLALGFGLALLVARALGWFQKFFAPGSFF